MKFSAYIPVGNITPGEFQSLEAIKEMAGALEQAGFHACCVTDHPAPSSQWLHANGHDALDPFTALAFVAAVSEHLQLQTNILVLPYRNPFITAKAAATLQVLSGGRFILGVGAGYQREEFDALGVDFRRRGALCDEALDTMRQIWRGGVIVREGIGFNATGNEPRPAVDPPPRIWIGGSSDKALDRAARAGDGWCPFFSVPWLSQLNRDSGIQTPADLLAGIIRIEQLRAELGRTGPFDIAVAPRHRLQSTDREESERFINELRALRAVGVTCATIYLPHPSRAAYIENIQWFREAVAPQL